MTSQFKHIQQFTTGSLAGLIVEVVYSFYRAPGTEITASAWTGPGYIVLDCYEA